MAKFWFIVCSRRHDIELVPVHWIWSETWSHHICSHTGHQWTWNQPGKWGQLQVGRLDSLYLTPRCNVCSQVFCVFFPSFFLSLQKPKKTSVTLRKRIYAISGIYCCSNEENSSVVLYNFPMRLGRRNRRNGTAKLERAVFKMLFCSHLEPLIWGKAVKSPRTM